MNAGPERKKFGVWTPDLAELNGQNIVTRRVIERQHYSILRVFEYPGRTLASIPVALIKSAQFLLWILIHRGTGAYIVCSRSTVGFFRDVLPLSAALFGRRVVAHVHGSDFPILLARPVIGILARWLYRRVLVIIPSQHLVRSLAPFSFRKLIVSENFASIPDADSRHIRTCTQEAFTVLWNSNVMASKGIGDLVESIRLLRAEGHNICLIILGKVVGDEEKDAAEMQRTYQQFAYEDWIDARGSVPLGEVSRLIEVSDLVALPSTYSSECQPLAIILAMIAGKRILVSDTLAMQATIGDYPAIVSQRDPSTIAKALKLALDSAPHQKLEVAAKSARRRFSADAFDIRIHEALNG